MTFSEGKFFILFLCYLLAWWELCSNFHEREGNEKRFNCFQFVQSLSWTPLMRAFSLLFAILFQYCTLKLLFPQLPLHFVQIENVFFFRSIFTSYHFLSRQTTKLSATYFIEIHVLFLPFARSKIKTRRKFAKWNLKLSPDGVESDNLLWRTF